MIWTILLVIVGIIIIKFLRASNKQSPQIKEQVGMQNKYSELIEYFYSFVSDLKITKETNAHIVLENKTIYQNTCFDIHHTFSTVSISWCYSNESGTNEQLKWEFDSNISQKSMIDNISISLMQFQTLKVPNEIESTILKPKEQKIYVEAAMVAKTETEVKSYITENMKDNLNPNQRKAVEYNGKHLLVLAGAGTGKTHTIINRAAYLINQGVDPSQIQILSFTKKSANEIVWRVGNMSSNSQIKRLNGSTFHSWCMELIKSNPNIFSHSNYTVIDRDDQISIFKLIYGRSKQTIETTKLTPKILLEIFSFARNTRLNITESVRKLIFLGNKDEQTNNEIKKHLPFLSEIFTKYQNRKKERRYLDYDDILDVVATGLSNNKEARNYISSKYKHILVDEMQDTNPLQWELLMCFQENCNLFCVGDDAQSIYAFRGADFRNVHLWKERMPNSEVQRLEDNYRSTQEILDLSNWLLNSSKLDYNKNLKAIRGKGNLPKIMNFNNSYDEAEWIVQNIIDNRVSNNTPFKEFLVLTRSAFGIRNVEAELLAKKIPYIFYGGTTLFKSAHIRDVLSCIRIIDNIYDEIAWMRYLQLWDSIGDVSATRLVDKMLNCFTLDECINTLKNEKIKDSNLYITLENIANLKNNPAQAITYSLKFMENILEKTYKNNWDRRKSDFIVLSLLAKKHSSISEFISEYILDPQLEESITDGADNNDKIILSTIHSAKGLEAKICYVINVSVGAFPNKISILAGEDDIEEERRVLYVALTRAKDELYITRNIKTIFDNTLFNESNSDNQEDNIEDTNEDNQEDNQEDSAKSYYFLADIKEELAENLFSEKTKLKLGNKTYKGEKIDDNIIGLDMS